MECVCVLREGVKHMRVHVHVHINSETRTHTLDTRRTLDSETPITHLPLLPTFVCDAAVN
jgi:hypothetical protein